MLASAASTPRRSVSTVPLRWLVVLAALATALSFGVGVARAHSGLAAASPGPGATVGGDVALVELFYGDLIVEFEGTVTRQVDGTVLDAEAVMTSEITGEIRLAEPLTEAGEYAVRHTVLSIDGDVVEAAYLFNYDPSAEPPILVFLDPEEGDDHDDGLAWWAWTIIGVGAAIIVVLVIRLLLAIRRARPSADDLDVEHEPAATD